MPSEGDRLSRGNADLLLPVSEPQVAGGGIDADRPKTDLIFSEGTVSERLVLIAL